MWRNRWHRRSSQCQWEHPARYMLENFYGCSSLSLGGLRLWRWFFKYRSLNIHSRNPMSMSHKDCWLESKKKKKSKILSAFHSVNLTFTFHRLFIFPLPLYLTLGIEYSQLLNSHLITPPPPAPSGIWAGNNSE